MARPRKIIPETVGINMVELASKILKMSDAEIGAWLRKAVGDCRNGCQDPDCDPFIKVQYEATIEEMQKIQDHNAEMYRRRLERQGKVRGSAKTQGESNTGSTVPAVCPESGNSLVTTTTTCQDKHKTITAEVTTPRAGGSRSTIIPEDGDTREGSLNLHDSGDGAKVESGTSSGNLSLAGAAPMRCGLNEKVPVSLSGTAPASTATVKKPYGTCGHVMLTDAEGHTLRETYGKHLAIAIDILDAYGENNPKKFAKYKNHAAVLRKGNWVWNKVQEMILNEKRIENASKGPKNWKAQERERNARVLRGESADGSNIVRDEDLTPEELEAKYA